MEFDRALVLQASRFINDANIHYVTTWIFYYEMSLPNTRRRQRYEELLREFVMWKARLQLSRSIVEMQRNKIEALPLFHVG
jgi:hypothetical protein